MQEQPIFTGSALLEELIDLEADICKVPEGLDFTELLRTCKGIRHSILLEMSQASGIHQTPDTLLSKSETTSQRQEVILDPLIFLDQGVVQRLRDQMETVRQIMTRHLTEGIIETTSTTISAAELKTRLEEMYDAATHHFGPDFVKQVLLPKARSLKTRIAYEAAVMAQSSSPTECWQQLDGGVDVYLRPSSLLGIEAEFAELSGLISRHEGIH